MREPPQGIDFFHLTTQDNPVSHGAVEDFCKLPVVIEAVQLPQECFDGAPVAQASAMIRFEATAKAFSGDKWLEWKWRGGEKPGLVIPTLEGDHLAEPGDWIIKGVKGEFYPCKPDIFAATYDPT